MRRTHKNAEGISIHAAREGGDFFIQRFKFAVSISIHAAREGGDPPSLPNTSFQPISIHAAREGGDETRKRLIEYINDFNPRRP